MRDVDHRFEIAAVEAFHLVADHQYWQGYRSANRSETERFVLKPGWRTVYGRTVETCLIKVTLRGGEIGWGEATEPVCPEVVGLLATELIAPLARGQVFSGVSEFSEFAYDLNRGRGHQSGYLTLAIAALDVALCDALARRAGLPLAALFSEDPAESLPIYLSGLRRPTREARIAQLVDAVSAGIGAAKIFVDANSEETVAEIAALRDAVPADHALMVDALWSYGSVGAARELSIALARLGVKWLECPLVPEDVAGHAALHEDSGVPIALGETFFTAHQLREWIAARAFDIYQPDIGRTGFAGGIRHAAMVQQAGLKLTPHMGTGSPVVQAAALHFHAAACRDLPCEFQSDLSALLPECFSTAWRIEAGRALRPLGEGLGVEIDEAALARHVARCFSYSTD